MTFQGALPLESKQPKQQIEGQKGGSDKCSFGTT
jgi:hypothetical protein